MANNMNIKYMKLAIREARKAIDDKGNVGAIIIQKGKVISKAGGNIRIRYNKKFGKHAEHNAILRAKWLDKRPHKDAVIYITYQPCIKRSDILSRTELIKNSGIKTVIYGTVDPKIGKKKGEQFVKNNGIKIVQIKNKKIQKVCKEIFEKRSS